MRHWFKSAAIASLLSLSGCGVAEEAKAVAKTTQASTEMAEPSHQSIVTKLQDVLQLGVSSIADAPVEGLVQVATDRGLFYVSEDGKYFLQARIFNLDEDMRDETDVALGDMRLDGVQEFADSVIEFKAENEKYVVNVFTDITCGYCRKLHNEIDSYLARGITIRYLAFPRGGPNSRSFGDMISVWCSDDKQAAMTSAKAGDPVDKSSCNTQVAQQYAFGQRIGVTGTPNIILPDGSLVPGYQPAEKLEETLKAI